MNALLRFVIGQRLLVLLATGLLAAGGIAAWRSIPIDAFPDVTNVQVMLLTEAPGLAPVDVEQQVTAPLERAMQGLPRVRELRSLSKSGLSQVVVVFEDDVDTYFARQLVFERVQEARGDLPAWADPEMGPISTGLGEIFQYTVESAERSLMELRTIQDWVIAPQLRALAGVNEVNSFGGFVKQYHVVMNPAALQKYDITLAQVLTALERNNANAGGGFLERGWEQAYVRTSGMVGGIADIENIVLRASAGAPVRIRDVARVEVGPQTRQGAVTRDGTGETVAGMVIMLRGENSKLVVDRVKKATAAVQAALPPDVRIRPFYDRTGLIRACIRTVSSALLQGAFFVTLILALFLGNPRVVLVVALALPLTASVAFLLMGWQGVTANLMSLGGLAIALGMVVDASIVVTENVMRHLDERGASGLDRSAIVLDAVREVARPVTFAIAIIIVVFLPLFSLEQMEGKMFKPLALTMCFAMAGSLGVALVAVPALSSLVLRAETRRGESRVIAAFRRGYMRLLAAALRRRWLTVAVAGVALAAVLVLVPRIGTEFMPALDEGAVAINVVRLPSASLDGSVAVGSVIEQRLLELPEVETVVTKTGRAEISEDPMGPEQSDVFVMLAPRARGTAGRGREELVRAMHERLGTIPGIRLSFSQPIALRVNELVSGIKSDLAIKLFGPDLGILREHANRIAAVLGGMPGAEDVKVEQVSGFTQIEIVPDRETIARHAINIADINELVETALGGTVATTVIEDQRRFAVLVRLEPEHRSDLRALERLLVPAADGARYPLAQLAEIQEVDAPSQISRESSLRRVVVECNIRGRDMGGFVHDAQAQLTEIAAELPPGYFIRYGGQFENQQRAMRRLAVVVPISIGLIFVMLLSALGTVRSALLVLVNLPFALVGGVVTMYVLGINLSVAAVIGFIVLFGTAVENGTVLVSFFNQLVARGRTPVDAVREACALRFRPLLMTTLTTLLGLMPLVYATGSGSELQRPLAAVVLGGVASALALTLLVLPVLLVAVHGPNPRAEHGREQERRLSGCEAGQGR